LVLGVFSSFHRFTRVITGSLRMFPRVRIAFYLFFQLGIFHFALEQSGARHQDGIVLLLADIISLLRLRTGIIQVSTIKVQQPAVLIDAANAMMVVVVTIDLFRLVKVGKRAAP